MRPKKLLFSEEDRMEMKRLRKELEKRIVNSHELAEIYAGAEGGGGGCGAQCMITCAHYCEDGCEKSCSNSCYVSCSDFMATGWHYIYAATV
jgi:hypothetical protein